MNKIIIALLAIYFLGDPHLHYLAWLGDMKVYLVAAASAGLNALDRLAARRLSDGPDTVPPHGGLRVAVFIAAAMS